MSSSSTSDSSFEASATTLIVGRTKHDVKTELCQTVARISKQAIQARRKFVVALSGGSLPSMLDGLVALQDEEESSGSAEESGLQFDKWWILLADERVVPLDSPDSNLGSIHKHFLSKVNNIPPSQIIGINQSLLENNKNNLDVATSLIADEYESQLKTTNVLGGGDGGQAGNGKIDLALLGFGPDGHTCSLFPGHALVSDTDSGRLIAPIMDSPKLPPHRITLTLRALAASNTRNIIICGTGTSKYPIIKDVFGVVEEKKQDDDDAVADAVAAIKYYTNVRMVPLSKTPYPSAMVGRRVPTDASTTPTSSSSSSLTWLIDQDALEG